MLKYELIPEQLLHEGTSTSANFFCPEPIAERWIIAVHKPAYWNDLKNRTIDSKMIRRIGFPLTKALVEREKVITQGTLECCRHAMEVGVALNVAGGTHHAFPDRGEGFCLLNDVGIAANYLLVNRLAERILIIDLDVHQGNGTAVMFRCEPRVFTFSMHGKDNYPLVKEKSDLDIPLPSGTGDEQYLSVLEGTLPALFATHLPDFVFYVAGVDILATDKLGHLALSREGCRARDAFVFGQCIKNKVPVVVSMGGGYSPRIADIVEAHCNTYREAAKAYF